MVRHLFENPYEEKLAQLKDNQIEELVVEREDFNLFREAWLKQDDKKQFVGEAGLGGRIIYRYQTAG